MSGWGERRTAVIVTVVAGLAFLVLAWSWCRGTPSPGGASAAGRGANLFTAPQLARAETYARWSRAVELERAGGLAGGGLARGLQPVGDADWSTGSPGPWWVQAVLAVAGLDGLSDGW